MKQVTFEHVFECDEDTYWDKCFLSPEYNHGLFMDTLKFSEWKQTIHEQNDSLVRRTVEVRPPVGDVSAPVRKILGDRFGYKEHGKFDRKTRRYTFNIEPSTAAEKTKITGEMWLEKVGDKKVRRIAKMHVEVNILMVGKLIEEKVINDMTPSYAKAADFTNAWVKQHGY